MMRLGVKPDATSEYQVRARCRRPGRCERQRRRRRRQDRTRRRRVLDGLADGLANLSLLDQILFIVDGVDVVLGGVQDVMDGEVLGFSCR